MRRAPARLVAVLIVAVLVTAAWLLNAARGPRSGGGDVAENTTTMPAAAPGHAAPATHRPTTVPSASSPRDGDRTATLTGACAELSLQRRAALTLVVGMPDVTDPNDPLVAELTDLGVGGVFLTGYNTTDVDQVRALADRLRAGARPAPLTATDEEWGRVSSFRDLLGSTSSPRTMAATGTPADVRTTAERLGDDLASLGIEWNFAPVADLDDGPADGVIGDRAFAASPSAAAAFSRAFARGQQAAGVIPTVKHFPGHGAVPDDVDPHSKKVASDVSLAELRTTHLAPFAALIDDGVPVVMLNHVSYSALDGMPASMSPQAYDLLRAMGFDGVAITDSIGMGAIHRRWDFPEAAVRALDAGADAVLATDGNQAARMVRRVVTAVQRGTLDEARLNQAAARMLALGDRTGDCG